MNIDLHIHSTTSDGSLTPGEIVDLAVSRNIPVISITDHDTAFGGFAAIEKAKNNKCVLVPGIELSSSLFGHSLHILGYFIDERCADLTKIVTDIRMYREERNHAMIAKFRALGIDVSIEALNKIARGEIISRPHFAQLLLHKNIVSSAREAFSKYLATGAACHVPRKKIPPSIMIDIINSAGGLSALAHPGLLGIKDKDQYRALLHTLKGQGLQGLEVYCSTHTATDAAFFLELAREFDLVVTGGSDFHGMAKPQVTIGKFYGVDKVFAEIAPELLKRGLVYENVR
jgi:3',5'-nucleoside bisphosphate phosphatase